MLTCKKGYSSASDTDYQHALEVVFDAQNNHRRKSSLVPNELPAHYNTRSKNTECYVHGLLEKQRSAAANTANVNGVSEALTDHSIQECRYGTDGAEEFKPYAARKPSLGQIDEQSWQENLAAKQENSSASTDDGQKVDEDAEGQDALHSRLLTKDQLSDMAWGVRELSKRLGSLKMKLKVKTVFLLTKAHDENLIVNTREVVRWLLSPERKVRYTVYVEDRLEDNKRFNSKGLLEEMENLYSQTPELDAEPKIHERRLRYWTNEICRARPHTFDFVVSLGGDGTVLYASWLFQRIVPPVLSFALGSLGFLTKFDYEEFPDVLTRAFRDGVTISLRLRFEGTVMRSQQRKNRITEETSENGEVEDQNKGRDLVEELIGEEKDDDRTHKPDGSYEILNDIVVDRGPNPTMSSIEIFGDDEHFTSVQADGVCVATPTGSTAYNLAAGGSLCHPENPVILVTAICAHTLSFRPIILPDTIVLRLGVPYDARSSSWASFDGRERVELRPGDYVTISASRYPFANVMPQGRRSEDWINSISGKLGWNTRQKQKSYKEWS
ncbi:ATP-NAD kinase-like protein [Calycina marina]|uniref:ATP-NAD kinase-like protein n=1 Tax=Calycina marina TaxID=1763456 RepID=A0A9P7ZBA9_9HELO|nr:ATP-NAD kinase-like protein [Calycina marina]